MNGPYPILCGKKGFQIPWYYEAGGHILNRSEIQYFTSQHTKELAATLLFGCNVTSVETT
jgi:hypothetical protein